jgi:hypothetical protein
LGPRILILKLIGGQINLNFHWFLKDEEAIDWRRGFRSFHWAKGTSSRKVKETFQGRRESLGRGMFVFWEKKKEVKDYVISSYV